MLRQLLPRSGLLHQEHPFVLLSIAKGLHVPAAPPIVEPSAGAGLLGAHIIAIAFAAPGQLPAMRQLEDRGELPTLRAGRELDQTLHGIAGLRFYAAVKDYFSLRHEYTPITKYTR
jgi:hypothetical protein